MDENRLTNFVFLLEQEARGFSSVCSIARQQFARQNFQRYVSKWSFSLTNLLHQDQKLSFSMRHANIDQ